MMSHRRRIHPPRSGHSTSTRDRALARLSRSTRWLIAGSVALTGVLSDLAANAFPGKTVHSGARSKERRHQPSTSTGPSSTLAPPQTTPETHTEAPAERPAEPAPETHEAAPETHVEAPAEAAPETHVETPPAETPAPETRVEAPAEGPVVSGGS